MNNNVRRIAICGYGNLGRGIEKEIAKFPDMELVAIFTRRDPSTLNTASSVPVISLDSMAKCADTVDVLIMCGGSATDLPVQVPEAAKLFNTVDSFDTHAKIPEYFNAVNESATSTHHTSIISGGWDPGMFSVARTYADAILSEGHTYTFWGKGVSQGHSDAIRRIHGVKDARQYTIPIDESMESVRKGENPELSTSDKHLRQCYVVAEDDADLESIEEQIITMPNYFADYFTTVHFISEDELKEKHSALPHGGFVIHSGETGDGNKQIIEYSLKLDSNPEFTSSVLLTLARATYRMNEQGQYGAKTILDIPPALLSAKTPEQLRKELL